MPELLDTGTSGTGWSFWSLLLLCEQRWAHRYEGYIAKMRGEDFESEPENPEDVAIPLRKGSVLHAGLAHHYALMLNRDVYSPREAMSMVGDKLKVEEKTMAELHVIFGAYLRKYEFESWQILEVEKLHVGSIEGVAYTIREDLTVRDETGRVKTVDHKSSSRLTAEIRSRYTLSGQFVAARRFGQQLWGDSYGGVIINGITSRASDMKFLRIPLAPIPGTKWEHFKAVIKDADKRRLEIIEGRAPRRVLHENVCMTQYGPCPYFDRCQGLR